MGELSLTTDMAQEKLYAATKARQKEQQVEQKQNLVTLDPSQSTGIQWATQQLAAAQTVSQSQNSSKGEGKGSQKIQIVLPDIDDLATVSTTVSLKQEAVEAPGQKGYLNLIRSGFNLHAIEESYREIYKKSRSHNLLLERFFSKAKLAAVQGLMSALGVSSEELSNIQAEVREEALREIDLKLTQDWAYTKAMIDITMG